MAIHLCIGAAYGFSVFWLPLSSALGGHQPITCGPEVGAWEQLFVTHCDWTVSALGWTYTLFFVFLGSSAAVCGGWVERVGPCGAGAASALCWCGGLLVAGAGVQLHQLWLILLGAGVIGGIGLGLGYIAPIGMLMAWYPDRHGLATGLAIMGFGGGAMIGSPLAVALMRWFATPAGDGVAQTFVALALVHFVCMMAGALACRLPPAGWAPPGVAGGTARRCGSGSAPAAHHVPVRNVWRIGQFWLLWWALCLNVSAGIGLIGMASPMLQEVFGGALIGSAASFVELDRAQRTAAAAVAAGFAALLSLFNIGGRLCWASLSDALGRKAIYLLIFGLGAALYASLPGSASAGDKTLFVAALCLIVSLYGGAFATLPAYVADLFGPRMAGAIHARLLTALALAGVAGPLTVNLLRDRQIGLGVPRAEVYNVSMYVLAGLLVVGLVCHLRVRPLDARHFEPDPSELTVAVPPQPAAALPAGGHDGQARAVLAWVPVGLSLGWGVWQTVAAAITIAG